jgi:hypothetical protein
MATANGPFIAECRLVVAAVLAASCLAAESTAATEYNFTTLAVPSPPSDAIFNAALSINDSGQVIVQAASGATFCCFVNDLYNIYTKAYTPLASFPRSSAQSTSDDGINDAGVVVGFYHPVGGVWQGFSSSGVGFSDVNAFGDGYNEALGISNNGQIVGTAGPVPGNANQGYLYSGGIYTAVNPLPYPANTNFAYGVNDAGEIVVQSSPSGTSSFTPVTSFLDVGGVFSQISMPGEQYTAAYGINDAGIIVGAASNDGFVTGPGFIDDHGVFTAVNVPGATETYIYAINNLGQIAGEYFIGGNDYAFVGTLVPEPATWAMMLIGFAGLAFGGRRSARSSYEPTSYGPAEHLPAVLDQATALQASR